MNETLQAIEDTVLKRNPNEPEFHQAVHQVLRCLHPLVVKRPHYIAEKVIQRLCEPERQIVFRVVWSDDRGELHVNRGFRVEFNSALGPYKGGLRFHPSVDIGVMKFLGFEQTFKNALTQLQIGGGKGGADFDPKDRSDAEVMRFCQAFMTELHRHLGAHVDVPAGDIGVGEREIGYLFGQYKRITNRYESGVLTGKGVAWGGSQVRTQAAGYGCAYFVQEMLATRDQSFQDGAVIVSGAGNVAIYAIEKVQQLGGEVIACSDTTGYVHDKKGIDVELLKQVKRVERLAIDEYARRRGPSARFAARARVWELPCAIALPCATQNELGAEDARRLIAGGVEAIGEGANMPCTAQAIEAFKDAGVAFAPGKAANAGGVVASAFEMHQNAARESWSFERAEERLRATMHAIHDDCRRVAEEYGAPGDYATAANIIGLERVAEAMLAEGAV